MSAYSICRAHGYEGAKRAPWRQNFCPYYAFITIGRISRWKFCVEVVNQGHLLVNNEAPREKRRVTNREFGRFCIRYLIKK